MTRIKIPFLHDHHSHGSLYAALADCPDVSKMNSSAARELLQNLPRDRLTLVTGYRNGVHQIDPSFLENLPPALIVNYSLHGYLVSASAIAFLRKEFPEIAENRSDKVWKESNIPLLFARYISLAGLNEKKLETFFTGIRRLGVGTTEDMSTSAEAYRIIRRTRFWDRFVFWMSPGEFDTLGTEEQDGVRGIKLYLDGSIGAKSAAIRGRYRDGGSGFLTYFLEELIEAVEGFMDGHIVLSGSDNSGDGGTEISRSIDLSLHAIGERAIDQALDLVSELYRNGFDIKIRVEHVQFITYKQARRARDHGIVLSMQPNFTSDSVDYTDRLDKDLLASNNPFRMLIDQAGFMPGRDLLFGSDGMPHDPAYAFRWSLFPAFPGQRLTLNELLAGYGKAQDGYIMNTGVPLELAESSQNSVVITVDEYAKTVRVGLAPEYI